MSKKQFPEMLFLNQCSSGELMNKICGGDFVVHG